MHLLLSGLDRISKKGFVFVDKHARHSVLNALITRPIWVFRCRSLVDATAVRVRETPVRSSCSALAMSSRGVEDAQIADYLN